MSLIFLPRLKTPWSLRMAPSASSFIADGRQPVRISMPRESTGVVCKMLQGCNSSRWSHSFFEFLYSSTINSKILHFLIRTLSVPCRAAKSLEHCVSAVRCWHCGVQGWRVLSMGSSRQLRELLQAHLSHEPSCCASGKVCLTQDKMAHSEVGKEMWETALPAPRSVEEEGEEMPQDLEQRLLCSTQGTTSEQISHCSPTPGQVNTASRKLLSVKTCNWSRWKMCVGRSCREELPWTDDKSPFPICPFLELRN